MSLLGAYRHAIILFDKLCFLIYVRRFEVVGREHVPLEGPLILVSNHLNNADPPAVALALPRHPTYMAKREMIGWPIIGPAFRIFGAFPVRRGVPDRAALRVAGEVVLRGEMLVMFPEGSRSRTGGLGRGYPGSALVALRTGAPLLPVAVTGTNPRPVLLAGTGELGGGALTDEVLTGLGDLVRDQIMAMKTTFTPGMYRRRMAGVLARRLVRKLWAEAG